MSQTPLGMPVSHCPKCGGDVRIEVPAGDNKPRYVCGDCEAVLYENPKLVVGCVTECEGKILLCLRSIEPRKGYWTVPAGFMELGETLAEAAARETLEEACAKIELGSLLAIINVVQAGQVHVFFRGSLPAPDFAAGDETDDARLFAPDEIPWDDIAFSSGYIALKHYLRERDSGAETVHLETAPTDRR